MLPNRNARGSRSVQACVLFAVTFFFTAAPSDGHSQAVSVESVQEFTGDSAYNLEGAGMMNVESGLATYSYGELDCVFGVTQMAGAGSVVTRAKCGIVDGNPSEFNLDQLKQRELSPSERQTMYLIKKSVAIGVPYVPLDFREGYGAQNWRLHIRSIECQGPMSGSWKEYKCTVKAAHTNPIRK